MRSFYNLQPGEVFRAFIHDIQPGKVTIRFSSGELYTARSLVLPDARIGEESGFSVKENDFEGKIILEMVKLDTSTKQNNMLTDALANAGISATPEMLELGRNIIEGGIPVDSQTLQKATFFAHAEKEAGGQADSVVFMLKENMPASTESTNIINRILHNPGFLLEILELAKFSPLHLNENGHTPAKKNAFPSYYRNLYHSLLLTQLGDFDQREQIREILNIMQFMSRLKHRKYFQIPFTTGEKPLLAEFHSSTGVSSGAAIAIETANLGRIEFFVHKSNSTVEFRADSEDTLKRLKKSSLKLKPVTVSDFKLITEPFTILTPLPDSGQKPTPERYTFDMRV